MSFDEFVPDFRQETRGKWQWIEKIQIAYYYFVTTAL